MDTLLALGRAAAPLALDLTLKISIAAGASLLAIRIVGHRRPDLRFALVAAALVVGATAGAIRLPACLFVFPLSSPSTYLTPAPPLPAEPRRSWSDVRVTAFATPAPSPAMTTTPTSRTPVDWLGLLGLVWIVGVTVIGAYLLVGAFSLRRMIASATRCRDPRLLTAAVAASSRLGCRRVPLLLLSPVAGTAYTAGVFQPSIVLPADVLAWPDGRVVSALLHETMHVKRRDNLTAEMLRAATALAWISPLPWLALTWAIRLREEACDEAVLSAGVAPTRYAVDLLEAARSMSTGHHVSTAAAMASPGNLERRIRAVLSWSRDAARPFARLRHVSATLLLVTAAGFSLLVGAAVPDKTSIDGSRAWSAVTNPTASHGDSIRRYVFSLSHSESGAKVQIDLRDRSVSLFIPKQALPTVIPLGSRARLARPFGDFRDPKTGQVFFNPGWDIREDRSRTAVAAAAGIVISNQLLPGNGPTIEIDHGFGIRTRYDLGESGSSSITPGTYVVAGDFIGFLGPDRPLDFGKPDMVPVLRFLVLANIGDDEFAALDPAPLVFSTLGNKNTPFAAAIVNAAVREADTVQVSRLIALGVNLNTVATDGTIPLEWAVLTQNVELARILVAAGANPAASIGANGRQFAVTLMAHDTGNTDLISAIASL